MIIKCVECKKEINPMVELGIYGGCVMQGLDYICFKCFSEPPAQNKGKKMLSKKEIDGQLENILEWTNQTLATGEEPPWSWYQFMKLREAIEAIRSGVMHIPISEQKDNQKGSELLLVKPNQET